MIAPRLIIPLLWASLVSSLVFMGGCASQSTANTDPPPMDPAEARFEAGAKRAPTADTLYALAQILAIQGKDQQAESVYANIIRQFPKFMPAYCGLAQTEMHESKNQDAIRTLQAALRVSPSENILVNDLGMCHLITGDYAAALRDFTRAAAMAPDEPRYRANLAVALGMMGRYHESYALYREILSAPDAHRNVARLCDSRGDHDQALQQLKLSQGMAPDARQASAFAAPQTSVETP